MYLHLHFMIYIHIHFTSNVYNLLDILFKVFYDICIINFICMYVNIETKFCQNPLGNKAGLTSCYLI